jgi:leucyl/phenylalanyl-tRNA--protein transferase
MQDSIDLTPSILLRAYANGLFPMGHENGDVHWYSPDPRAVLPLDAFHIPDNLDRRVRRREFCVTSDVAFDRVIRACADRDRTWITPRIIDAYTDLHRRGYAHSVEAWVVPEDAETAESPPHDAELAGGLYGVMLGGGFFGESMFFTVSNASKVTLVHLVRQLRAGGAALLDTQYSNPHLEQFGVVEISRDAYLEQLADALTVHPDWWPLTDAEAADLNAPVDAFENAAPRDRPPAS